MTDHADEPSQPRARPTQEPTRTDHLTDDELRELAVASRYGRDAGATVTLVEILKDRVQPVASRLARYPDELADIYQDLLVPAWSAIKKIAEPGRVSHPWAYLMQAIDNGAQAVIDQRKRIIDRVARQEIRDLMSEDAAPEESVTDSAVDDLHGELERWKEQLEPEKRRAVDFVSRGVELGSRDAAYTEAFGDDPDFKRIRDRFNKMIARGREPGGFINQLRRRLERGTKGGSDG